MTRWTEKNLVLKLPGFFARLLDERKHASNSKQTNFSTQSSRSCIVLALASAKFFVPRLLVFREIIYILPSLFIEILNQNKAEIASCF